MLSDGSMKVTASILTTGQYIDAKTARLTVAEWCDTWLAGYTTRRPRTVRQAEVHITQITAAFGPMALAGVRPSTVRAWTARLKDAGHADSYVFALHNRLSQIMSDAVHDGVLVRNPCSRRTSPGSGKPRPYGRARSRCGLCTTPSRTIFSQRFCWAPSSDCGPPRSSACG
jgi:hypothetical protein